VPGVRAATRPESVPHEAAASRSPPAFGGFVPACARCCRRPGAGPIGLAAILTPRLYTPGRIVAIDLADSRLESAVLFGADTTISNGREDACAQVMDLTDGLGADVAFEAVGVRETFELATEMIRPGRRVANMGVHGRPATLHLEKHTILRGGWSPAVASTRQSPRIGSRSVTRWAPTIRSRTPRQETI
jgi:threonine dehydrogenase-like Zn-dependent dehydrogenase